MRTYRIAGMSRSLWWLSAFLLAIPVALLLAVLIGSQVLLIPLALVTVIYAWVWLRFRPTCFAIHPDTIEIIWPLKRRTIPRASVESARIIRAAELKHEVGWGVRVGAGGLWGGFGWLWTQRRGIVQMYVSRLDEFVWIERGRERPWLITPEHPEEFVYEVLSGKTKVALAAHRPSGFSPSGRV